MYELPRCQGIASTRFADSRHRKVTKINLSLVSRSSIVIGLRLGRWRARVSGSVLRAMVVQRKEKRICYPLYGAACFLRGLGVSRGSQAPIHIQLYVAMRANERSATSRSAAVRLRARVSGYNLAFAFIFIFVYIYMRLFREGGRLGHRQGARAHAESYALGPEISVVTAATVDVPVRTVVQVRRV